MIFLVIVFLVFRVFGFEARTFLFCFEVLWIVLLCSRPSLFRRRFCRLLGRFGVLLELLRFRIVALGIVVFALLENAGFVR